jgi:hypothetical protein
LRAVRMDSEPNSGGQKPSQRLLQYACARDLFSDGHEVTPRSCLIKHNNDRFFFCSPGNLLLIRHGVHAAVHVMEALGGLLRFYGKGSPAENERVVLLMCWTQQSSDEGNHQNGRLRRRCRPPLGSGGLTGINPQN